MAASRLAALALAGALTACVLAASEGGAVAPAADPAAGPSQPAAYGPASLLEPEPLGFDVGTARRLAEALRDLPAVARSELTSIAARGRALGPGSSALVVLLFLGIAATLVGQRRLARRAESAAARLSADLGVDARAWLAAAFQVLAHTAPPFLLWIAHDAVRRATGFGGPGFLLTGLLLLAWTRYALVVSALRELLLRPLLPIAPQHGRYVFAIGRGLAVYGLLLYAMLEVGAAAGVPADMLALAKQGFDLLLIAALTALATRKAAILALLPDVPNSLYRRFVAGLGHAWGIVLVLTAATALLAWAGYTRLAEFIWIRTWAVAGLFVAAVLLLQILRAGLRRWVARREGGDAPAARRFVESSAQLLDYAVAIVVLGAALELTGFRDPLARALARPLYTLADRPVTLLMLVHAALVIAAFLFLSRLVRSFLDYRVYPSLKVEDGIAHAINLFIAYAFAIVGFLFSLEFVGLGVGAVTVFAGALGIGLGFGLQSLANNLSSGLTLAFGRSLRRGDLVKVGDTVGVVEEVGMRATSLRTRDSVEYLVPNSDFASGTIVNWTRSSPYVREHVPVGVATSASPEQVRDLLLAVARADRSIERDPPPEVWFTGLGDNSLQFELLVWVDVKERSWPAVKSDLYFAILARFRDAGIEIPFPQRDVHLRSISAAAAERLGRRDAAGALAQAAEANEAARTALERPGQGRGESSTS